MYVATEDNEDVDSLDIPAVVVKERGSSNGKALAMPQGFERVSTDTSDFAKQGADSGPVTAADSGPVTADSGPVTADIGPTKIWDLPKVRLGFYRAIPPKDYVALSDVAVTVLGSSKTTFPPSEIDPHFRCVHKSLVTSVELGDMKWPERTKNGRVWNISESAGFKVSQKRPENQQWRLDYIPGPLFKRMRIIDSLVNMTDDPITRKYTKETGSIITADTTTSIEAGISTTIGLKASEGIFGIASAEENAEFTAFLNGVSSFSRTESSTALITDEIEYTVPSMKKIIMYQLCVSDAKDNTEPSVFEMKSMHIKIVQNDV
jgi:hypothetical protein